MVLGAESLPRHREGITDRRHGGRLAVVFNGNEVVRYAIPVNEGT